MTVTPASSWKRTIRVVDESIHADTRPCRRRRAKHRPDRSPPTSTRATWLCGPGDLQLRRRDADGATTRYLVSARPRNAPSPARARQPLARNRSAPPKGWRAPAARRAAAARCRRRCVKVRSPGVALGHIQNHRRTLPAVAQAAQFAGGPAQFQQRPTVTGSELISRSRAGSCTPPAP